MRIFVLALIGMLLFWNSPVSAAEQSGAQDLVGTGPVSEVRIPGLPGPIRSPFAGRLPNASDWRPNSAPIVFSRFSQGNDEWRQLRYDGRRTLGEKGCTVVSSYIGVTFSGHDESLPSFTERLRVNGCFDNLGRLRWHCIAELTDVEANRLFAGERPPSEAVLSRAHAEISAGNASAVQLQTPFTREHWIVIIGQAANGDLLALDPAGGRFGTIGQLYGYQGVWFRGMSVFQPEQPGPG